MSSEGGERVVVMVGVCMCVKKWGQKERQVMVIKHLGGKQGKERPEINLILEVEPHSSTKSEKRSMKNTKAILPVCENLASQKSKNGYNTTEELGTVLIHHSLPF